MTIKPPVETVQLDADAFGEAHAFADAHRQLLADGTIQFDLPGVEPPPEVPDLSGAIPVFQTIFWIAVAAIVLFILYLIAKRLSGADWSRKAKAEADAPASWRPEAGEARELLGDADALAGRGLYSEAARLLLFRSIEDIDAKRPDLVRPALTSRDIAALEQIPGRPRSAFLAIAMMVERSLFAERPLAADDWGRCRSAYEEFAFAEGWRG
ncbi:MAG: hypothetical protein QOG13_1520 [Sphingomonadales bacterium]|jgi:hypothetical protein|nr:hypothetical protein [Sphingomonadales bacterium]MEA3043719.1 hypothetical protein [Sphingomonadales bacterium]